MSRATQDAARLHVASRTGLSPSADGFSKPFRSRRSLPCRGPTTPAAPCDAAGLGCSTFARHYWGNHFCFLFLRVLRCFSSPRSPTGPSRCDRPSACRVFPFGDPRITGHVHLPAAYRSLSRPSSPVRAKASAIRPCLLSFARTCRNLIPLSDVIKIFRHNGITKS